VASLTGRDSIDANATVLFNLLWRNLEEALMKKRMLFSFLFQTYSACGGKHKAAD